jgi:hypothetical protein
LIDGLHLNVHEASWNVSGTSILLHQQKLIEMSNLLTFQAGVSHSWCCVGCGIKD